MPELKTVLAATVEEAAAPVTNVPDQPSGSGPAPSASAANASAPASLSHAGKPRRAEDASNVPVVFIWGSRWLAGN